MKVYIVEVDIYESRSISGVFESLEGAKASVRKVKGWNESARPDGLRDWWNGLDFSDCATIWEEELLP